MPSDAVGPTPAARVTCLCHTSPPRQAPFLPLTTMGRLLCVLAAALALPLVTAASNYSLPRPMSSSQLSVRVPHHTAKLQKLIAVLLLLYPVSPHLKPGYSRLGPRISRREMPTVLQLPTSCVYMRSIRRM